MPKWTVSLPFGELGIIPVSRPTPFKFSTQYWKHGDVLVLVYQMNFPPGSRTGRHQTWNISSSSSRVTENPFRWRFAVDLTRQVGLRVRVRLDVWGSRMGRLPLLMGGSKWDGSSLDRRLELAREPGLPDLTSRLQSSCLLTVKYFWIDCCLLSPLETRVGSEPTLSPVFLALRSRASSSGLKSSWSEETRCLVLNRSSRPFNEAIFSGVASWCFVNFFASFAATVSIFFYIRRVKIEANPGQIDLNYKHTYLGARRFVDNRL